jgi:hypothetical protein
MAKSEVKKQTGGTPTAKVSKKEAAPKTTMVSEMQKIRRRKDPLNYAMPQTKPKEPKAK